MQRPLVRILTWLGLMALLTLLAMGGWMLAGGDAGDIASLKWLQLWQTLGTFLLPAIISAWIWSGNHRPFQWLKMRQTFSWQVALLAVIIMVCAIPAINLLADLNSRIVLPDFLDSIEQELRQREDAAEALTRQFLQTDTIGGLILNIGLLALLPGLAEEISFRGTLQQLLIGDSSENLKSRAALAIWTTAAIFSAVHMQFYGFVPRMLMGAMFGYVFLWTGCLWIPILMHFTNNGIAVICYYFLDETDSNQTWVDTVGSGSMWFLGVISIIVVIALLRLLYNITTNKKTQTV